MKVENKAIITRSQYMANEFTHEEYYGQFVDESMVQVVDIFLGDRIRFSLDNHFNDISLDIWDKLIYSIPEQVVNKIYEANEFDHVEVGLISILDRICVLKAAARVIKGN